MKVDTFQDFFRKAVGQLPHPWQQELAGTPFGDLLLRIPTGFGKTAGAVMTWALHRCLRRNPAWPARLIFCLPMRVLVEQTASATSTYLRRVGLDADVKVHILMGGADESPWFLEPERPAVLVGTQDMLLSRALLRGYASPRARWPMEFGLLNHDCLWVMDEVQLMDVGLATSVQLQAFRREDAEKAIRPCATWWMSATLQADWFTKSPEAKAHLLDFRSVGISSSDRSGPLWEDVRKDLEVETGKTDEKSVAKLVAKLHLEEGSGSKGPTLVVLNRVDRAVEVARQLIAMGKRDPSGTEVRLVHSRYRPAERAGWSDAFLNREACGPGTDRIIVSTQVVEAGVDISAALLVTDLAPWASLVQRFGRAARWGGRARIVLLDTAPKDDKAAAPYSKADLDAARDALHLCPEASPRGLEAFEESHPDLRAGLYRYEPRFLLLRREIEDLFDTSPDLSGDDVDISRFIRSGDERDLHVAWVEAPKKGDPPPDLRPGRDALCPVRFIDARRWLGDKGKRAWTWDWIEGAWRRSSGRDLFPGQTVLVDAECGGYTKDWGWSEDSHHRVDVIAPAAASPAECADSAQEDDALSGAPYKTIATHGLEVAGTVREICAELGIDSSLKGVTGLAGRLHDAGKAHETFQSRIKGDRRPERQDLAKAPDTAWVKDRRRPGFRHELASVLALFGILRRHAPDHPALLGRVAEMLRSAGMDPETTRESLDEPTAIEKEVLSLEPEEFDLLAYLICSHHGKVRVSWHSCPSDQETASELRILGVCEGDKIPSIPLAGGDGAFSTLPETVAMLGPAAVGLSPKTGKAWTDRVLGLLERHGPFALAFLEAVVRVADQRASKLDTADPLLDKEATR